MLQPVADMQDSEHKNGQTIVTIATGREVDWETVVEKENVGVLVERIVGIDYKYLF